MAKKRGNPYHDKESGQFTTAAKAGKASKRHPRHEPQRKKAVKEEKYGGLPMSRGGGTLKRWSKM